MNSSKPEMVLNGTPHPITIVDDDGNVIVEIPVGDVVIRCTTQVTAAEPIFIDGGSIPTAYTTYGETNLPAAKPGVVWVVSQLVKAAHPDRDDLLVPTDLVRDEAGNIIGAKALGR